MSASTIEMFGFSTHILTRRMTILSSGVGSGSGFFNSHPHKEDDVTGLFKHNRIYFSTHILTRRMTWCWNAKRGCTAFSTHILTRRMTMKHVIKIPTERFSTHILTRRMTQLLLFFTHKTAFSTHILTRRMTLCSFHTVFL